MFLIDEKGLFIWSLTFIINFSASWKRQQTGPGAGHHNFSISRRHSRRQIHTVLRQVNFSKILLAPLVVGLLYCDIIISVMFGALCTDQSFGGFEQLGDNLSPFYPILKVFCVCVILVNLGLKQSFSTFLSKISWDLFWGCRIYYTDFGGGSYYYESGQNIYSKIDT